MKTDSEYLKSCPNPWQTDPNEDPSVGGVFDMQGNQVAQVSECQRYAGNRIKQNRYRDRTAAFIAQAPSMYTKLIHVKMYLELCRGNHRVMIDDIIEILDEALNEKS